MNIRQAMSWERDAIAGIADVFAAAIVLHLLHIVDETVVLPILLVLLGPLLINFMRHSRKNELTVEQVERMAHTVDSLHGALERLSLALIGPRQRRPHHRFLLPMSGDSIWSNVCLAMYRTPCAFRCPAAAGHQQPGGWGPIQFVLDQSQREL